MVKKILLIFGIIFVLVLVLNYVAMPLYVKHSSLTKVPDVVGLHFNEAKKILEDAGLNVKQGDIRYDSTTPVGTILEQSPTAGEIVKSGRRVYLVICGGEQLVEVPRLSGRTIRDAKFTLDQRNLQIGEITKKFSNQYPEDVVISQVIQPGSKVKRMTKIDVIVSNGPQIGNIIIPDLIGKKLEEAKKILTEKKLKVGRITYQTSDLPAGQILDQYPKKDKSAVENTPVDLFVAKKKVVIPKEEIEDIPSDDKKDNDTPKKKEGGIEGKTKEESQKQKQDVPKSESKEKKILAPKDRTKEGSDKEKQKTK
ncbi:MAG: PASTA domain-containing protein [Ignavibacteria bacterium]|nr:PASTA domain-containing protein [Ignavibacteria bacterium]